MDRFQFPNTYNHDTASYGGGVPVWRNKPNGFRLVGSRLVSTFLKGELLHEGSPVYYNAETHESKILKCFKITAVETSGSNTIVTLAKNFMTPSLNVGMNLMVAPSAIDGTGKSVTITSVDTSVANYYKVTLVTSNIDAVSVGKYLVEAESQGSAVHMYCQPNSITVADQLIGDVTTIDIPRNTECSIYVNTMPDLPSIVFDNIKSNYPLIESEYFNVKQ